MAKRKKIYATREAILKDIDAARRKMKRLRKQSLEHDGESKIWFSMGNEVNANNEMDESARLWRKASRIENTRLKRLGATLAMFDTVPLGGDGLDKREVVLQNL